MGIRLESVTNGFVAEVTNVDLRQPLDKAIVKEIVQAMDLYGILIFRNQPLSQQEQVAFGQQFGPLESTLKNVTKSIQSRLEYDVLTDISNVDTSGKVAGREHRQTMMNIGNMLWHSDGSFMNHPFRYSMLSAITVVDRGGNTEFADLRAAYDALDETTKTELEDVVAEHFAFHSRQMLGFSEVNEDEKKVYPPVRWPLVRTHAGSGRKLLYVGVHAREIIGMPLAEGRVFLQELLEHTTQREFVYRHHWRVGDLVMWDNRATIHRGRRFDLSERREMRRVGTVDDVASLPSIA